MPRLNVIVLDKPDRTDPNTFRYAMWADVPAARQVFFVTTAVSAWKDATAQDNTNIQSGAVVEKVTTVQVPAGATLAQIEAELQARWTAFQNDITSVNPWSRYGTTWNGTTWVAGGVA